MNKYRNRDCIKLERFCDCGDYDDFEAESSETNNQGIKNGSRKWEKVNKNEEKSEKKSEEMVEKCPFIWSCFHVFEKPCKNRRLNHECLEFECEDCGLYYPDYGKYCKTSEYKKCETYENLYNDIQKC